MSKQLHINISDDEVKYLLDQDTGYTKGFRRILRDHRAINDALKESGLDALSPRDLVGLIKCLVGDKKRLKTKMGA